MVCFVFYVTGFTSIVVYCFPPFLEHINTAPFWFTSRTSSMKHSTTSSLLLKRLQSTNEQKTDTVMGRGQTDLLAMWPIDLHTRPIVYFFIRLKCLTVKSLLCSCCRSTAVNKYSFNKQQRLQQALLSCDFNVWLGWCLCFIIQKTLGYYENRYSEIPD